MRVAGIDLSGRTTGRTALAWLEGEVDQSPSLAEAPLEKNLRGPSGDLNLVAALREGRPQVVAIDAPLKLPHPVGCTDPSCGICFPDEGDPPTYTARRLERADLWKQEVSTTMKGPMPMVMIAAIAFRAIYLRRALEREDVPVVETWPMGVYRVLESRAGSNAEALDPPARHSLLRDVVGGMKVLDPSVASADQIDAIAAAYAAWCHATGQAKSMSAAGFEDEGEIWLPAFGR